ncbi:MAG: ABC transporter permease, partial [Chloroflexi bacterium]
YFNMLGKIALVIKFEIFSYIKSVQNIVFSLLMPLTFLFVLVFLPNDTFPLFEKDQPALSEIKGLSRLLGEKIAVGVVSEVADLTDLPELFQVYSSQKEAEEALAAKKIIGYYFFDSNYPETGQIYFYSPIPPADLFIRSKLKSVIAQILVDDPILRARIGQPINNIQLVEMSTGKTVSSIDESYLLAMLFFGLYASVVIFSMGHLLHGLRYERNAHLLEILLTSIRPSELITGKLIGLLGISLIQLTIWAGVAIWARGYSTLTISALSWSDWVLFGLYLISGYFLNSPVFVFLSIITSDDNRSFLGFLMLFITVFAPQLIIFLVVGEPQGKLAIWLSIFPLTSPFLVPLRMLLASVPVWQHLLSLAILWTTAVFSLWLLGRIFQAHLLLAGFPLNWHTIKLLIWPQRS